MSPELEVLDQLCGGDLSLSVVLRIFGGPAVPALYERAARAVAIQVQNGEVLLMIRSERGTSPLQGRHIQEVLADQTSWSQGSPYSLSITEKGSKLMT